MRVICLFAVARLPGCCQIRKNSCKGYKPTRYLAIVVGYHKHKQHRVFYENS